MTEQGECQETDTTIDVEKVEDAVLETIEEMFHVDRAALNTSEDGAWREFARRLAEKFG